MGNDQDLSERLNKLKDSVQSLWNRIYESDFELTRNKMLKASKLINQKLGGTMNREQQTDSISEKLRREAQEDGVEVKKLADNAPVEAPGSEDISVETSHSGISSFGEEDTFDPEEADEHQTYRDRKQNSDLNERFQTGGMDIDESDLKH